MICRRCGAQFEGNFCPNCGNRNKVINQSKTVVSNHKTKSIQSIIIKICAVVIILSIIIIIGVQAIVANGGKSNEKVKMSFNEYLITASQMAIIHAYDLPLTTHFSDKTDGNYDVIKTKTENVYNIGGTVRIKNNNGILKDYKYVAKIEYLPKSNEYKEISAKIIE